MPVDEIAPPVVASPYAWVSRSNSRQVTPPWARAVRAAGSTLIPFIGVRSIIRPPSQMALPATLWPPPRTLTTSPRSRANRTALATSPVAAQRAIRPGRRSIMPLKIVRASS